jgi:hypothetical protein
MEVKYQNLGLKNDYLYEILATTLSIRDKVTIPNTSCMGIRIRNNQIILKPYQNTKTYENLKTNSLICINFVENVYLYALAALKDPNLLKKYEIFPEQYYNYYIINNDIRLKTNQIPYVKDAWAIIICKTKKVVNIDKEDVLGTVKLIKFKLEMLSILKLKDSYKLFNRAENLTLEALILTTRFKIAVEKKNYDLMRDIQKRIDFIIEDIERFSENQDVAKSINLIKDYIRNLKYVF